MVLYTYSAPDVSPADPCNKVAQRGEPQPSQTVLAPGSMEWLAAKNKSS